MSIKGGFFGKILLIDLTHRTSEVKPLDEEYYKKYIGGALMGAKMLYDELEPKTDPLGEDNKLIYVHGPLSGTNTPCSSRLCIATKSPLTGTFTASFSGGHFPVELKKVGYDAIVISGKADSPVYILIKNGNVTFNSANKYWGLNVFDTQMYMKEDLGNHNIRISCIGPAGENQSLISGIFNEARTAGRKGVGAVMGSKNLKALAVIGTNEVPIANPEAYKKAVSRMLKEFKSDALLYPRFSKVGSTNGMGAMTALGLFPSNNWISEEGVDWYDCTGTEKINEFNQTNNSCYRCPVSCSHVRMVKRGKYAGISSEGPEYETLWSFGALIGVKNPEFTIVADRLCDELGLDTISAGATVAFAMELYEKGIFTDTDGLELKFGNEEETIRFLRMIAQREGFAEIFADGTKKAAERLGGDVKKYTLEVKGLELPAYDVRGLKSHGLNFATSYTGADHNRGYASQEIFGVPIPYPVERLEIEGKGKVTKFNQDFGALFDIMTFCEFPATSAIMHCFHEIMSDLATAITGISFTEKDLWEAGERMINLARLFNLREGFTRKDDTLPHRIMNEPLKYGLSKGEVISQQDLDYMLDEYYEVRGWDENGVPTKAKLIELGLA